jgi:hypothetical protein
MSIEVLPQSIADRCCGSGAILDVLAEAGLVNKVMPEWRKLRDPANFLNKADDWPEIEIEQDTYITPGNAIASKERWKIAGRWAKIGRKGHVHTIGTKRVLDFNQPWLYWSSDRLPPEHMEGFSDLIMAQWRDWYQRHGGEELVEDINGKGEKIMRRRGVEAVRCGELVPSVPTPARGECVVGAIHTQTIEGFWSTRNRKTL